MNGKISKRRHCGQHDLQSSSWAGKNIPLPLRCEASGSEFIFVASYHTHTHICESCNSLQSKQNRHQITRKRLCIIWHRHSCGLLKLLTIRGNAPPPQSKYLNSKYLRQKSSLVKTACEPKGAWTPKSPAVMTCHASFISGGSVSARVPGSQRPSPSEASVSTTWRQDETSP